MSTYVVQVSVYVYACEDGLTSGLKWATASISVLHLSGKLVLKIVVPVLIRTNYEILSVIISETNRTREFKGR
jgi:hypothetical protein